MVSGRGEASANLLCLKKTRGLNQKQATAACSTGQREAADLFTRLDTKPQKELNKNLVETEGENRLPTREVAVWDEVTRGKD